MPGHAPAGTGTARARRLLVCGVVAGPLWVVSVAVQALTRPGFSLTRSPASTLDLGPWGWVQVATFIVTGVLIIAAGAGMRRGVPDGLGHRWIPRLLAVIGAGTIGGGLFHPDPAGGYPPGAAAVASWHGVLHAVCGTTAFIAMVAVCLVFARRFAARGRRGLAACSRIAAVLVAAGAATASAPHGSLNLYAGVSIAFLWIAAAITWILTAARPALPAVSDAPAVAGR
jgi:hypothetical protein